MVTRGLFTIPTYAKRELFLGFSPSKSQGSNLKTNEFSAVMQTVGQPGVTHYKIPVILIGQ